MRKIVQTVYYVNIWRTSCQAFVKSSSNCHQTFAKRSTVSPKCGLFEDLGSSMRVAVNFEHFENFRRTFSEH